MIDTLVAFGCSNTQGDEAVANSNIGIEKEQNIYYAYPFFLSKKLSCSNYYNFARVGSSNHEIAACILNNINNFDPLKTFIVIGWTDNNRIPVTTYTTKSYKILQKLYGSLSLLNRLKYREIYKQQISNTETEVVTLSKGIVRIIYAKLFGIKNLKNHEKYSYETTFKPFFSDNFITGVAKHIFNTQVNDQANDLYKIAVERVLHERSFKYLMLTTLGTQDYPFSSYFSKNYFMWEKYDDYVSIIHEYGSKYGMAESGVHMKALAHSKLADFLYSEILRRNIL